VTTATPAELMGLYDVYDERGKTVTLADLPSAKAARGEHTKPLLVRNVTRSTGEQRWLLHKSTPVFDAGGALSMIVSVIEDLTEVKRAELAQRLLAEAGQALSSSLDYQETLQRMARLTVPGLADWCAVLMRGDDDVLEQVSVATVDPDQVALAREAGARHPARLSDGTAAAQVIRSGRARLISEIGEEPSAGGGIEGELLGFAPEVRLRSLMIVPLAVAGHPPIGAMALAMADSGRVFDEIDLALARELGHRAAIAVENARLYNERSLIATTLQRSLLPPELPDIPGLRLAGFYQAAGEQNDVGGDFYDVFDVRGGWMVLVGDVAGRGPEAAALTSLSRYTLRTAGRLLGDPVAALEQLNAALRERPGLSLVSVCCALLRNVDGNATADVVLAGHPPALHVQGGNVRPTGVFAAFLGAYEHGEWNAVTVRLDPGDLLVLYTDGVIDTVGEADRFGEDRLAQTVRDATDASDAVARIHGAVTHFARGPQVDDVAVIAVERVRRARASPSEANGG
jgi:serine phosphatase RsbU (regulator of sigma subunit)